MRYRALFLPSGVGFAHTGRSILLARELRLRGCQIRFAYGGPYARAIERAGFEHVAVAEVQHDLFDASPLLKYQGELGRRCIDDEIRAIDRFDPHVIVSDLRPTSWISAAATAKPLVVLKNAALCDDFDHGALFVSPQESGDGALLRFARSIAQKVVQLRALGLGDGLQRLAKSFLPKCPARSLFDFFRGDLELVCDLPEFAPLRESREDRRIIGPVIWDGGWENSENVNPGDQTGWIYVTAGNTGDPQLVQVAIEAFTDLAGIQVLISTGAYHVPEEFGNLPPNVHAYQFLHGGEAVARCELAIHCGGDGSTYQCLRAGTPMVVAPSTNDQRVRSYLIRKNRVGVSILGGRPQVKGLRLAVRTALSRPEIQAGVRAFARRHYDGAAQGAEVIARWIANRTHIPVDRRKALPELD